MNGELTIAKTVIIPHTIMNNEQYSFNEQVEKFKSDHEGQIKELHYSHTSIAIAQQPLPLNIKQIGEQRIIFQCMYIAYFLYEVTEEEYKAIKNKLQFQSV